MSDQAGSQQHELTTVLNTNKALQQQVQDMTTLLATEQEKTLTLLKDKKEVIKQKHDSLKVGLFCTAYRAGSGRFVFKMLQINSL